MADVAQFFRSIRQTRDGFRAQCPKCEHDGMTFSWKQNESDQGGIGCCFAVIGDQPCAWHPNNGGVTYRRLLAFFNASGTDQAPPTVVQQSAESDVKLPDEFKLIEDCEEGLRRTLLAYLASRGFDRRIVYKARTGYCNDGRFWGYLICPVFEDGEVMWWQGRRFKNRTPKFYNPASSKKSELLYRISNARKPGRIVVVETGQTPPPGMGTPPTKVTTLSAQLPPG